MYTFTQGTEGSITMHTYTYIYTYMYKFVYIHIYIYAYMYICLYSHKVLELMALEKRPKNAQNRHLQKVPDLESGTEHSEGFGHVIGQEVVG